MNERQIPKKLRIKIAVASLLFKQQIKLGQQSIFFFFTVVSTLCTATQASAIISEFQPNPVGSDPAEQTIELSGTPLTSFSGVFLSIESDSSNVGTIDRLSNINGTFDANGLLTTNINDLENPSNTVVLLDSFTGSSGDDLDTDDDGVIDDSTVLNNVLDAIGIPDINSDEAFLYGQQLGGTDFTYTGSEPQLIFRDASVGQLFAVNDPAGTNVFDVNASEIPVGDFNSDPTATSFGAINPTISSVAVPFEFSPALGLLTVGGIFSISRLRNRQKLKVK